MKNLTWLMALLCLACEVEKGPLTCSMDPPPLGIRDCRCDENSDPAHAGAVVVRWRTMDVAAGRLFQRGQCCCAPDVLQRCADADCQHVGADCPLSAPWIIPYVDLLVSPQGPDAGVGEEGGPCVISTRCSDAELTTAFCLREGPYDLHLVARVGVLSETLAGDMRQALFSFPASQFWARVPPATRRIIRAGQIVNLDAVVLGVNAPQPVDLGPGDGGADAGPGVNDAGGQDAGVADGG